MAVSGKASAMLKLMKTTDNRIRTMIGTPHQVNTFDVKWMSAIGLVLTFREREKIAPKKYSVVNFCFQSQSVSYDSKVKN